MDAESQLLDVCNELLNKIRETPENKKCFDCCDKSQSPRYVCTNFHTVVCSCCANIHKEFGHDIKCMNLFGFTLNEILMLRDSGNKLAYYRWLANWTANDYPEPDPTSLTYKENARDYMRIKYVEKRWIAKPKVTHGSGSDDSEDDWAHLHDDKPPSPYTLRASTFGANNPFFSPSSNTSSPYISSPSRMSFPPQSGHHTAVTIDLHQLHKSRANTPSQISPHISPPRPTSGRYNPFIDDAEHAEDFYNNITQRSPLRSRTMRGLTYGAEDEAFRPTVRIRSASAHCLLNPAADGFAEPIYLPSGHELKIPTKTELKFPSKALPPTPTAKKETPSMEAIPPLPLSPRSSTTNPSPSPSPVKDLDNTTPATATTPSPAKDAAAKVFPKSPLKLNTLVKVLSSMKINSPNSESNPSTPTDGEAPQLSGESANAAADLKGKLKVQGIMNKMAGLLPKRPAGAKN